jgi:hypothetical protein
MDFTWLGRERPWEPGLAHQNEFFSTNRLYDRQIYSSAVSNLGHMPGIKINTGRHNGIVFKYIFLAQAVKLTNDKLTCFNYTCQNSRYNNAVYFLANDRFIVHCFINVQVWFFYINIIVC